MWCGSLDVGAHKNVYEIFPTNQEWKEFEQKILLHRAIYTFHCVRWATPFLGEVGQHTNTPKNWSFVTHLKIRDGLLLGGPHTHILIYLFFFWEKNLYFTQMTSTLFLKLSLLIQYYKNSSQIMVTGKNRGSVKSWQLIARNIPKVV